LTVQRFLFQYYWPIFILGDILLLIGFLRDNVFLFTVGGVIYIPFYFGGLVAKKIPIASEPVIFSLGAYAVGLLACGMFIARHI